MHKDLSDGCRTRLCGLIEGHVMALNAQGQSLAIARQAMIEAFDKAAAELD